MPSLIRKRKRADGKTSYLARVPLPDGEIVRQTFDKEKDARKWVGKLIDQRDHGEAVKPSSQILSVFLDDWLANVRRSLRENTFESYVAMLNNHIRPALGKTKMSKLTRASIQRVYDGMEEKGLSPRTVRYAHSILHNALDYAVKDRRLARNPSDGVSLPRERKAEMRPFSAEEARGFLAIVDAEDEALDDRRPVAKAKAKDAAGVRIAAPMAALFHILIATGLRPSEAFALKWEDIDLEADGEGQGSITVRKSLTRLKDGSWVLNDPKTKNSRRSVPIPPQTLAALRAHRSRQMEHRMKVGGFWREQGFVFTTAFGDPLEVRNTRHRHFKPALKKLAAELHPALDDGTVPPEVKARRDDLMRTRMYDLRHTTATLALAAGVNVKVVSERLGHGSIVITLDTYAHVLPSMQKEATSLLGDALYG